MKTLITTFAAPKTAGCSSLALNSAIAHQLKSRQIGAFIQITPYPDIDSMAGISQRNSWKEISEFYSTDEWAPNLLNKASQNVGIDLFQSPDLSEWSEDICERFFQFFELVTEVYDFVYIDLGRNVETAFTKKIIKESHQTMIVQTVDPSGFRQVDQFLNTYKPSSHSIIINQVSPSELKKIGKKIQTSSEEFCGVFPFLPKNFWHQTFEGVPVYYQGNKKINKNFESLVDSINGTSLNS